MNLNSNASSHMNLDADTLSLLQLGQIVSSRYRVVREIQRGGSAVVYEGSHVESGRKVALKTIRKTASGALVTPIEKLRREIELVSSLPPHPHFVQLLDVCSCSGEDGSPGLILVYELVTGPDLLDLLNEKGGKIKEAELRPLAAQIFRGVAWLHSQGLAHRDIKPENVMLCRVSGTVKLIDFGLAKNLGSVKTKGIGTPDYLAPECIAFGPEEGSDSANEGPYDAKVSDSFALGVLLFLLLSGKYPFEDPTQPGNVLATLQRIQAGLVRPLPPHLSFPACDLIAKLLQHDPRRRLSVSDALGHGWFNGWAA